MPTASDAVSARIPLILGVTGHRDLRLEDREILASRIRDVIWELRRDYPETPLVLLSPLNEGADRLVAEVALAPELGVRLIAVMPWAESNRLWLKHSACRSSGGGQG